MIMEQFYRILDTIKPDHYGCHIYPGATLGHYFRIRINGDRSYRVNRLALERKLGRQLQRTELACHTCDEKACVNPEHLFLGTAKENIQDSIGKGRYKFIGAEIYRGHTYTVSTENVRAIRKLGKTHYYSGIAEQFNVSYGTVARIVRRLTYRNVPD